MFRQPGDSAGTFLVAPFGCDYGNPEGLGRAERYKVSGKWEPESFASAVIQAPAFFHIIGFHF
jgi:hypothetical protein